MFNFLWSREKVAAFAAFLGQLDFAHQRKLYICYLVQPLTQIFFRYVLTPVFFQLDRLSAEELLDLLVEKLREFTPLFPSFIRSILVENRQIAHDLFWESFLKPVLKCPSIFGIVAPDIFVGYSAKFATMIDKFILFFQSESALEIVLSIADFEEPLAMLPSDRLVARVDPDFTNPILWDTKFMESPSTADRLVFVANETSVTRRRSTTQFSSLGRSVCDFLKLARLVKLRSEFSTTLDFFRRLKELSTVEGNAQIEAAFHGLSDLLVEKPMTIDALCEEVEADLVAEEAESEVLSSIADYSFQKIYVGKLKETVDIVRTCAIRQWEFDELRKLVKTLVAEEEISPEQVIQDPEVLTGFYKKCLQSATAALLAPPKPTPSTRYNLYSAVLMELDVVENFERLREDLSARDRAIQSFLAEDRGGLLDNQDPNYRRVFETRDERVELFFQEMKGAFDVKHPLQRLAKIHNTFEILTGILYLLGEKEVGADQIVPFALIGLVFANPLGLASTGTFFNDFLGPIPEALSPLEHAVEYSRIQFVATCGVINTAIGEATSRQTRIT
jgi:hypothetical protein